MLLYFRLLLSVIIIIVNNYRLTNAIPVKADFIASNHYGQVFICENNILKKYDDSARLISIFSNQQNGEISSIDLTDPYKLLLFYKDLNKISFLDDRMAIVGNSIELDDLQLYNVSIVCKSKQFAVWIYDDFNNRLIQYAYNPKGVITEINLDPLNIQNVIFMRESGNYLFVNTGEQIFIFDYYGSFIKKIDIKLKSDFQVNNEHVVYFKTGVIISVNINDLKSDTLKLDFLSDVKNIQIENSRLYVQKSDSVLFYKKEN